MTFDPDKALQKARESVHGFYFDGPSDAESRVEHLEQVVSALFRQERKLKLERLMYKADARAWEHHREMNLPCPMRSYAHHKHMMERWESLYVACADKLEELKK
jgi:hypothetical protein